MTKPKNWVKVDVSPEGTFITARRFLGRNPETSKNSVKRGGFHAI